MASDKVSHTFTRISEVSEESAKRMWDGKMEGVFRVKKMDVPGVDGIYKEVENYYARHQILEQRGAYKPMRIGSWRKACEHNEMFLRARLAANIEKIVNSGTEHAVAIVPFMYRCPHPTSEETEAYMRRWNDDGDLNIEANRIASKASTGVTSFLPLVIYTPESSSMVLIAVALLWTKN
jgi:hypothetical protein